MWTYPHDTAKKLGTENLLKLLRLSDRFQVSSCIDFCCEALGYIETMAAEEAVTFLSYASPERKSTATRCAKKALVATFTPLFSTSQEGNMDELRGRFLRLPEHAMKMLLGDDELRANSDALLREALAWLDHQVQGKEYLRLLGEVIFSKAQSDLPFIILNPDSSEQDKRRPGPNGDSRITHQVP